MSQCAIKLEFLATGESSPFDGQYVKEFDPFRLGKDPHGKPMVCHLVTTPNIAEAKIFDSTLEAFLFYRCRNGDRPDGSPNRPLTAFCASFPLIKEGAQ